MSRMRFLLFVLFTCVFVTGYCQQTPVRWKASVERTERQQLEVNISGEIAEGWYVYAYEMKPEGLEPIQLVFEERQYKITDGLGVRGELVSLFDSVLSLQTLVYKQRMLLRQTGLLIDTTSAYLSVTIKAYAANGTTFLPIEETIRIKLLEEVAQGSSDVLQQVDLANPIENCGDSRTASKGYLQLFFVGFIGGLIALLTPCVFPMIPVTVSFFTNRSTTKQEGIKNGVLYGSFIFLIYIIASVPFHLLGNISPEIFNTISTNAWVNVFFFAVFIFFALSLFGLFELRMPSALTNVAGTKGSLASMSGIFFMALTLATVSFSCTGPILGSLLVGSLSSKGGAWQLSSGMGGFGAALALPFALFAMFPQWMKRLPKSGGWMETVKKVLAFAELALALKFLSNADLVEHWGLLKREVFIGLWFVIAFSLSIYLFNVSERLRYGVWQLTRMRFVFAFLSLAFSIYLFSALLPGSKNQLALLSGFPPPANYSLYVKTSMNKEGLVPAFVNDYDKALAKAKAEGKPLLIDFTGWACVNCRKMEEIVWTDPKVAALIQNEFILVSLYVDDRTVLPAVNRRVVMTNEGAEREIKTEGDRWAYFQAKNFKQVTQPLYVILSNDEKLMNHPVGYTADVDTYKEWLECGVKANEGTRNK